MVYDTSVGLIFEKRIYYKLENPKVTAIINKERTLRALEYEVNSDIEKDNTLYL